MEKGLFSRLTALWTRPFNEEMDLLSWALFVGLILVLVILWSRVLSHIEPLGE